MEWNGMIRCASAVIVFAATTSLLADSSSPRILSADLNSDGTLESIVGSDNRVTITDGATGAIIVRFEGDTPTDNFGAALLVLADHNGDGDSELLGSAPGANALYVIRSPWMSPGTAFVSAARADAAVRVPDHDAAVSHFGEVLRTMFVVDGDSTLEIQVPASVTMTHGASMQRMYILSPSRGEMLVQFDPVIPTQDIPEVLGDVDSNAEVTIDDLTVIVENFSLPVPSRRSGDLNGDGVVGLDDLTEVVMEFGRRGYEPAPTNNALLCDLGTAGTAWVTPRAASLFELTLTQIDATTEIALGTEPAPGYFPPGFWLEDCGARILECAADGRVQNALRALWWECDIDHCIPHVTITCKPCPLNPGANLIRAGTTLPVCRSTRSASVTLCSNGPDLCATLAHELMHVAQMCSHGLFRDDVECAVVADWYFNPFNQFCMEFEAHRISGLCEPSLQENLVQCCGHLCNVYRDGLGWRIVPDAAACTEWCGMYAENCCQDGEWRTTEAACPLLTGTTP